MLGILEITVLRASNLRRADMLGQSDPYVQVSYNDTAWSTFIADQSSSTAIWNERLTYKIENVEKLTGDIQLEIHDKDVIGEDDLLFRKSLPISISKDQEYFELLSLETNEYPNTRLDIVLHYNPLSSMQKIYAKIDEAKTEFKKKLINQIMDQLQRAIGF